jgi:erythronate-4-phosphate dehydrogenase
MQIVVDENIPFAGEAFSAFGDVITVKGRDICSRHLQNAEMLLVRSTTVVNETLLKGTPVKFVASATVGIDHVDLGYLSENNIGFAHAPGSNADSVAEYIITAIIHSAGKNGYHLGNLTIGIIGVGNVGRRVVTHADTLGMRSLLFDPPKQRTQQGGVYRPLDEVLAESDVVSLHVPLITGGENKTAHMVDESFLRRMKKGAVLINTARGKVINEQAVISHRRRLGGLVLDVWDNEPAINTNLLQICDIATPHIAGYSFDGKVRGTLAIYEAANAFYARKPQWNPSTYIFNEPAGTIDLGLDADPVSSAVMRACPIIHDDRTFRKICTMEEQGRSAYYDEIRHDYPRRMEFPHYVIKTNGHSLKSIEQLRLLGFTINRDE